LQLFDGGFMLNDNTLQVFFILFYFLQYNKKMGLFDLV
jgi:hypothetical protein